MSPTEARVDAGEADVRALDEFLFSDEALTVARGWCHGPTLAMVDAAADAVADQVTNAGRARIVDYGSGSGLAAKLLAKGLADRGVDLRASSSKVELIVADLPGPWFAAQDRLADLGVPTTKVELREPHGPIVPLDQAVGEGQVDVVMASMVLHLIPQAALPKALDGIRRALGSGGTWAWTSPDSSPGGHGAILVHDPNRAVRRLFLDIREGRRPALPALSPEQASRLFDLVEQCDEPTVESVATAQRQIPDPSSSQDGIEAAHRDGFRGHTWRSTFPMDDLDLRRLASIPSNLKNVNEMPDPEGRRELVELLMRQVLPDHHQVCSAAGKSLPLSWLTGLYRVEG